MGSKSIVYICRELLLCSSWLLSSAQYNIVLLKKIRLKMQGKSAERFLVCVFLSDRKLVESVHKQLFKGTLQKLH